MSIFKKSLKSATSLHPTVQYSTSPTAHRLRGQRRPTPIILEHPICRRVPSESTFHTKIHESKSCRSPKVTRVLKLPESKVARFQNLPESKVARVKKLPESKTCQSQKVTQVQQLPESKSRLTLALHILMLVNQERKNK